MEAFGRSSESGQMVEITTPVARPEPLSASLKDGVLG
jgi:hypothetical protein